MTKSGEDREHDRDRDHDPNDGDHFRKIAHELAKASRTEVVPTSHAGLRHFKPFQGLADDPLEELWDQLTERRAEAGEVLVEEGTPCSHFFLVLQGAVAFLKVEDHSPQLLFHRYGGDYFGELDLFDDARRPVAIHATEPCSLLEIPHTPFRAFLDKQPEVLRQLELSAANAAVVLDLGRRREVRIRIHRRVDLQLEDGQIFQATLENLSPGGLRLRNTPPSWPDTGKVHFGVQLPQGLLPLTGRIVWRTRHEVGIALERDSVDHDTLMHRVIRTLVETGR